MPVLLILLVATQASQGEYPLFSFEAYSFLTVVDLPQSETICFLVSGQQGPSMGLLRDSTWRCTLVLGWHRPFSSSLSCLHLRMFA